ncbi:hypothetical protein IGK47_002054 [Enterococcus sp. AZ007]
MRSAETIKKKLLYTREIAMPEDIYYTFAEKNIEVITIPLNRTVIQPYQKMEQDYDWIFFTSANAVKYFDFNFLNKQAKILAIGNQTVKVLKNLGFDVDFQPKEAFSEGLVKEWLTFADGKQRVFWPHSFQARRVIYNALTNQGHDVLEQVIYRNEFYLEDQEKLRHFLLNEVLDYVLFASPSAWMSFSKVTEPLQQLPADFWSRLKIAAIGPVTAKAIKKKQSVVIQPKIYDMPHLYECLLQDIEQEE